MSHTIGEPVQDAWLPIGTKLNVMGEEFLITDVMSKVNYAGVRTSDNKRFKFPRNGRYIYAGFDPEAAEQAWKDSLPKFKMGDIVKVREGKFAGKVGIVAIISAKSFTIAIPNEGSIRMGSGNPVEVLDASALVAYVTK